MSNFNVFKAIMQSKVANSLQDLPKIYVFNDYLLNLCTYFYFLTDNNIEIRIYAQTALCIFCIDFILGNA